MADFYICSYLLGQRESLLRGEQEQIDPEYSKSKNLFVSEPRVAQDKQYKLFTHDTEATFAGIEGAAAKLFPRLKDHMLKDILFALCAEIRHIADNGQNYTTLNGVEYKFVREYFKDYKYRTSSTHSDVKGLLPRPATEKGDRISALYSTENRGYLDSLKATRSAQKKTGFRRSQVVALYEKLFREFNWSSSFGGDKWGDIAACWLALNATPDDDLPNLSKWIDHAYDLEHNTGTVFTKLSKYDLGESRALAEGFKWIKNALDFKRDVTNPRELLQMGPSSDMLKLAQRAFQALDTPPAPSRDTKNWNKIAAKPSTPKKSVAAAAPHPSYSAPTPTPTTDPSATGPGYVWKQGTWTDGTWKGGAWENGMWLAGTWLDGSHAAGLWLKGDWMGGIWTGGTWEGGTWHNGTWKGGYWKGNGTWLDGTWENGIWKGALEGWKGGTWIKGQILDPATGKYEKSTVSPAEYLKEHAAAKSEPQPAAPQPTEPQPTAPAAAPVAKPVAPAGLGSVNFNPKESRSRVELDSICESLLLESPQLSTLKSHRVKLTTTERNAVINAGAVWHHGENGARTPGVWKSVVQGKTWFVCNTHRAYQAKPTLRGAISAFKFIQSTA